MVKNVLSCTFQCVLLYRIIQFPNLITGEVNLLMSIEALKTILVPLILVRVDEYWYEYDCSI